MRGGGVTPTGRLIVAVAMFVVAAGGGVTLAAPPAAAAPRRPIYYVALGDSRAVSATWRALLADGCGDDSSAYPALVAAALHVSYVSRACSGATTADVISTEQLTIRGFRPTQVSALSARTRLVTLSIGGNDVRWGELISPCFTRTFGRDARCRRNKLLAVAVTSVLKRLGPRLDATLRTIARDAPHARIVVVGHGGYFGPKGCPGQANISVADARTVLTFFDRFDAVIEAAARRAHVMYVDVAGPARGHDTCTPPSRRWFEGNETVGDYQSRHATPLGRRAIADLILAQLRRSSAESGIS